MNLKQLEHLLAVAETGSFSRAGEAQHISQSALSRSIQVLEDDVGGKLIDRGGKRNELTPLGQEVVARARHVLDEMEGLRLSVQQRSVLGLGELRIAMGSGPAALLMAPLLRYFAERHPKVCLGISRGPTEMQLNQLRARELDVMVVDLRRVIPAPDLKIEPLGFLRGGFICRAGHPLTNRPKVTVGDLLAYPVGATPLSNEVARKLVALYGSKANPAQMVNLQCEDLASLILTAQTTNMVLLGILAAARDALKEGSLVALDIRPKQTIQAEFGYVTLARRAPTPIMELLRKFVVRHVRD